MAGLHGVLVLLVVLLSLEQVFAGSKLQLFKNTGNQGKAWECDTVDYQLCHRITPFTTSMEYASSAKFQHKDKAVKDVSVTFYTGDSCDGEWFRRSGVMHYDTYFLWGNFGAYNGQVNSYKVANFQTSNGDSGDKQQPPDGTVHPAKCKLIRKK
ncbi:hypothetical protein BJ944DRAFT_266655 [Cunninghamella echinulata]|nr:hypothetical protein BJ944DRAFT_266655 [Cunninghamella echinulata]